MATCLPKHVMYVWVPWHDIAVYNGTTTCDIAVYIYHYKASNPFT
jgi:hypothetical protein